MQDSLEVLKAIFKTQRSLHRNLNLDNSPIELFQDLCRGVITEKIPGQPWILFTNLQGETLSFHSNNTTLLEDYQKSMREGFAHYEKKQTAGSTLIFNEAIQKDANEALLFYKGKNLGKIQFFITLALNKSILSNALIEQAFKELFLSLDDAIGRLVPDVPSEGHSLDQEHFLSNRFMKVRLELIEFATDHSMKELLEKALDLITDQVESPIGFYHFVHEDQKTLLLQAWSTKTKRDYCRAEAEGMHYPIDQAGVWVDCVRERGPVIHNDYASLSHKKGLPQGHAPLIREMVVPVFRRDKIVAILGVGNKKSYYTQRDMRILNYLSDVTWEIVERKKVEQALRVSEARHRNLFEYMNSGVAIYDTCDDGQTFTFSDINRTGVKMSRLEKHEIIGRNLVEVHPAVVDMGLPHCLKTCYLTGDPQFLPMKKYNDGQLVQWVENRVFKLPSGQVVTLYEDRTPMKQMEDRLKSSEKMEALGRMAGGIAHDFNNVLGGVVGYADLTLMEAGDNKEIKYYMDQIIEATEKGQLLVEQILTYNRKNREIEIMIDLNREIEDCLSVLQREKSQAISIHYELDEGSYNIKGDPLEFKQVINNLCVNALQAMDGEGILSIELNRDHYIDSVPGFLGFTPPGEYIVLSVKDTGKGMSPEIRSKIFDPFFTTQGLQKGLGMGLAVVYAVVKDYKGNIQVESQQGEGSLIRLLFPQD